MYRIFLSAKSFSLISIEIQCIQPADIFNYESSPDRSFLSFFFFLFFYQSANYWQCSIRNRSMRLKSMSKMYTFTHEKKKNNRSTKYTEHMQAKWIQSVAECISYSFICFQTLEYFTIWFRCEFSTNKLLQRNDYFRSNNTKYRAFWNVIAKRKMLISSKWILLSQ